MVVDSNLVSALSGINWCYVSGVLEISLFMLEQTGASRQPLSQLQDKLPKNKYLLTLFPKPPDNTYRLKPWIKLVLRDDCSSSHPEAALHTAAEDIAAKISTTVSGPHCLQLLDVHRLLLDSCHSNSVANRRVWMTITFLKARDSGHRLADLLYHQQEVATAVKHLRVFVERSCSASETPLGSFRPLLTRPDTYGQGELPIASLDTGRDAALFNRRLSTVLKGSSGCSSSSEYDGDGETSAASGGEEKSAIIVRAGGEIGDGERLAVDCDSSEGVPDIVLGESTSNQAHGCRVMGMAGVSHCNVPQLPVETTALEASVRDGTTAARNSESNTCIEAFPSVSNIHIKRKAPEECLKTGNGRVPTNNSRSTFKKQKVNQTSDLNNIHLGSPLVEASSPRPSSSMELKTTVGRAHTSRCSLNAREPLITPGDEALPYSGLNYDDFVQDEQNYSSVQNEQIVADAICSSSEAPISISPKERVTVVGDLPTYPTVGKIPREISPSSTNLPIPSPSESVPLVRTEVSTATKTGRTINEYRSCPSDQDGNEASQDDVPPSSPSTSAVPSDRQTQASKNAMSGAPTSKIFVDFDGLLFTQVKDVKVNTRVDLLCIVRSVVRPPCFLANSKSRRTLVALVDQSCGPGDDFMVTVFQNSRSDVLPRPICEADVVILRNVDIKLFQGQLRGSHTLRGRSGYETLVLESSATPSPATEGEGNGWTEGKHPMAVACDCELTSLRKWWQQKQGDLLRMSQASIQKVQMPAVVFPYPTYNPAPVTTFNEVVSEGYYDVFCRVLETRSLSQCPMAYIRVEDGTELLVPAAGVNFDALTQAMEESASQMPFELEKELSQQHAREEQNRRAVTVCLGPSLISAVEFCRESHFVLLRHMCVEKNTNDSSFSFSLFIDNFSAIILLNDGHPQVATIQRRLEEAADVPTSEEQDDSGPVERQPEPPAEEQPETHNEGQPESPNDGQPEPPDDEQPKSPAEGQPEPPEGQPEPPAEGQLEPPAEGQLEPPAEGQPDSPTEGQPESPAEGQPESPAEGQPESPAEGQPESSAEGQPDPPDEEQPKSPAEEQPEPPAEGQSEPPAEGQPEPPAEGQLDQTDEEQPEPPAKGQPEPPAEGQPEPPAEGQPEPPAGEASGRYKRDMSLGEAGGGSASQATTGGHSIDTCNNLDDSLNRNNNNNVSVNDDHVNRASDIGKTKTVIGSDNSGADFNTVGDLEVTADTTTERVYDTGEKENYDSFQHLDGGAATDNVTNNDNNADVTTDPKHQASSTLCSPDGKVAGQNSSETALPSPTQPDRLVPSDSCVVVTCDGRDVAIEDEELIQSDLLQMADGPVARRIAREWVEEVLGPFKAVANCRKTDATLKVSSLLSSKPDCSVVPESTLSKKEICLNKFMQHIRLDDDARADADERFNPEEASAILRENIHFLHVNMADKEKLTSQNILSSEVILRASASVVDCEWNAISGELHISPRATRSILISGGDSLGRNGIQPLSSSGILAEHPRRDESAAVNKNMQSLVTKSELVSPLKDSDCIHNANCDTNTRSSSQYSAGSSLTTTTQNDSICKSPSKETVISNNESPSSKDSSARVSEVSAKSGPLCRPNKILSNPPSQMPECSDQGLSSLSGMGLRILRTNQMEDVSGTGRSHSVSTSVQARVETTIVGDGRAPQPSSLEPCLSGTDAGSRIISTEGSAAAASQSAQTHNLSAISSSQCSESPPTPNLVLNRFSETGTAVEASTFISTAGKQNIPHSSAALEEACAEVPPSPNTGVTPCAGTSSSLRVGSKPTPVSCGSVSAAASLTNILNRSGITLTDKTSPFAVTSRERDDVSNEGQCVIQECVQAPPLPTLSWRALLSSAARLQPLSGETPYRLSAVVAALEPWAGGCGQRRCRESGSVCVHNLVSGVCGSCGAVYTGTVLRWLYTPVMLRGQRLPCPACCPSVGEACYPTGKLRKGDGEGEVQEEGHEGLAASERDERTKSVGERSASHNGQVGDKKDRKISKRIRDDTAVCVSGASNSSTQRYETKSSCKSPKTPQSVTCRASSDGIAAVVRGRCDGADSDMTAETWYTANSQGFSQRSVCTHDYFYSPKEGVKTRSNNRGHIVSPRGKLFKKDEILTSPSRNTNGESSEKSLSSVNHPITSIRSCSSLTPSSNTTPSNKCSSVSSFECSATRQSCPSTSHTTSPSADLRVSAGNSSTEKNCSGITTTEAARHRHLLRPYLDLSAVLVAPPCGCGCAGASFTARVRLEAAHKLLGFQNYSFDFCISSPSQVPDVMGTLASAADANSYLGGNQDSSRNDSQDLSAHKSRDSSANKSQGSSANKSRGSAADASQGSSANDSQDSSADESQCLSPRSCSQLVDVSRPILTRSSTFRPKVKAKFLKKTRLGAGKDNVVSEDQERRGGRLNIKKKVELESDGENIELELSCEAGTSPEEITTAKSEKSLDEASSSTRMKREDNFQSSSCKADSTTPSRVHELPHHVNELPHHVNELRHRVHVTCSSDRVHVLHVQASSVSGPRSGGFTLEVVDVDT